MKKIKISPRRHGDAEIKLTRLTQFYHRDHRAHGEKPLGATPCGKTSVVSVFSVVDALEARKVSKLKKNSVSLCLSGSKFLSLFFVAIILLTACGAETDSTATAGTTPTAQATKTQRVESATASANSNIKVRKEALRGLEISVWHPWYGVESKLFETFVKEFNKTNEWGIKVSATSQINFTNLYENTTASLPTTGKPDLVIALPEHAMEWSANKVTTDLTPYVEDAQYGVDASDFPFVFWNQEQIGGQRVAIPAQRNARFLLWNKTWASKLGFSASPADPEKFRKQACAAQQTMLKDETPQNDFKGGWLVDTQPMTAYSWLLAFGGGVLESGDYRFLTPNNIEAFKFMREISEKQCAWESASADPFSAFANRQALFISASLEDFPEVERAFASAGSTDKWEALAYPSKSENALAVYGSSYIILKTTDAEQLASWLFVRWLLDNKQDARWVEATHLFPLRASTVEMLSDYAKTHPQWAQAVKLLPQGEVQPQLASWRKVKMMLGDGFAHIYRVSVPSGQVPAILALMESTSRSLSK